LVELATGFLFLGIFLEFPFTLTAGYILSSVFYALIGSLLIVIVAYDLRHTIIPNLCVYSFIALTFLWLFIDIETMTLVNPSIISILAGPLVAFPLFLLWLVSRGKWMGLGDAKIALGIGFMLGIYGGFSALMISFWAGALVSVIFLALQKKTALSRAGKQLTIKSEIPFAPFLVFGFFLVFFFNLNVFVLW
jgi:leader peptidase (prepilin peptidase)/N-methyltransferase|tara:strand:+ start:38354 stop:38929 length:576 start_codon:yes stop_codon:yes gene_type:complete